MPIPCLPFFNSTPLTLDFYKTTDHYCVFETTVDGKRLSVYIEKSRISAYGPLDVIVQTRPASKPVEAMPLQRHMLLIREAAVYRSKQLSLLTEISEQLRYLRKDLAVKPKPVRRTRAKRKRYEPA